MARDDIYNGTTYFNTEEEAIEEAKKLITQYRKYNVVEIDILDVLLWDEKDLKDPAREYKISTVR